MDAFKVVRPILFALPPESAHSIGLSLMRFASRIREEPMRVTTALGELANPLGLPAGYDKTGSHLHNLARLGFGYMVAGTFTLSPWPGNPKPRVARNKEEKTLVNALGFPNPGIDAFIANLETRKPLGIPLVASISGKTVEDVLVCYSKVQKHVAGVELNLSSPNTPDLRDLREPAAFAELAQALRDAKAKPTYLKIAPFVEESQFEERMGLVKRWESLAFEGVTASNSIPVEDARMAVGKGGRSGPPLLDHTKKAVERIRRSVGPSFEVNACGGISSPRDAAELLKLGATTVQVFTALVYQGPALVRSILADSGVRKAAEARTSSA
ncbi:MAG TPA: dihydroorotate dehydrogenase 2 [Nitrososphaerales archaeon]|nr:dihydroorotate dehydrogenase 2 [Nitrososphaerales archaeon]